MGQHVRAGSGSACIGSASSPSPLQEVRRVAFGRVRQQLDDHVEQLGARRRRCAPRRSRPGSGGLRAAPAPAARAARAASTSPSFEVALDEGGVDLDHLLDQRAVRRVDAAEVGCAPSRLKKQSTTRAPPASGRFSGRHSLPKAAWICASSAGQVDARRIDLVDDDDAVELARRPPTPSCACAIGSMPVAALIDDGRGLHRLERRQRSGRGSPARRACRSGGRACRAWSRCSSDALSECCMRRSSGSKSLTVVPRSRLPGAPIAPARCSRLSARLVLPAAAGPTRARVRMAAVLGDAGLGMGVLLVPRSAPGRSGPAPADKRRPRIGRSTSLCRARRVCKRKHARHARAAVTAGLTLLERHLGEAAQLAAVQLVEPLPRAASRSRACRCAGAGRRARGRTGWPCRAA